MTHLKETLRWLAPHGVVESKHRRFRLNRLGLSASKKTDEAVKTCRYDLWPAQLKRKDHPWTLVDVGANEGDFIAAATDVAPISCVHAFEPQIQCKAALESNLANVQNHHLHCMGVGEENGELEFNVTRNSRMASFLPPVEGIEGSYTGTNFSVDSRQTVPVRRLDDILPEDIEVGLLKIDVQGYELPALRGAERVLSSTQVLLMEVNYVEHYRGAATFEQVYDCVRENGFTVFAISEPHLSKDGPLWADAVFWKANPE